MVAMGVIELTAQHNIEAVHNPQLSFLAPFLFCFLSENIHEI